MGVSDWLKRKMAILAMATYNVEKNALSGENKMMSDGVGQERRLNQDRLSDALQRGEVTQQVKEMRWRMYKILNEVSGTKAKIVGVDDDGNYIVEYRKNVNELKKVVVDEFDSYPLEMVIPNSFIQMGMNTLMGADGMVEKEEVYIHKYVDSNGVETGETEERTTKGELKFEDLESQQRNHLTLMVNREFPSKINIENYTQKLNVRTISEDEKLLEFYVNKYYDDSDRKTKFLISEIKKCIANPRASNIIELEGVGFMTHGECIGVHENLLFEYGITRFDKIVEFGGHYIIKFMAKPLVKGDGLFEKYRLDGLDEKYANKAKKDI